MCRTVVKFSGSIEMKFFRPGKRAHQRKGAAHVLIAAMMFTFILVAAMMVDFAYMQLTRTELRTATDAAAKAGAEALARTQDPQQAIAAAVQYAALNRVANRNYTISSSDVTLGRVTGQNNGQWSFSANATPYNAVRVNAKVGNSGAFSAVPLFFGGATGHPTYSTSQQATAGQQEVEVCLCLDRSGSMMFDMSGVDWAYPANNPLRNPSGYYPAGIWRDYCSPPHPTLSRWAVMNSAINTFLTEAGQFQYPPRTALVTWSSDMSLPYYPNYNYSVVTTDIGLPAAGNFSWTANKTDIQNRMTYLSGRPVAGGTTLSEGLDQAVDVLTGPNGRALSNKVIILLTDGQWNAGRDPVQAAQDAANAGITVHCVSMLTATQATLTQVASITGGQYYATQNATQLQNAFRDLARSLPIVLTD